MFSKLKAVSRPVDQCDALVFLNALSLDLENRALIDNVIPLSPFYGSCSASCTTL